MALLIGISIVFMAVAYLVRQPWTLGLPFVIWIAIYVLSAVGILPGGSTLDAALLAGAVGAFFAVTGLVLGRGAARRQPRA